MKGVYWGLFNPPHKGHMRRIKQLSKRVDLLIIAIGSAQEKNTARNPFSGKERAKMLNDYLKEERVDRKCVKIIAVKDGKSYRSSFKNLARKTGGFDVLFSDKKSLDFVPQKTGIKLAKAKRSGSISSTKIRKAIAEGMKWKHLTGRSVAKIIKEAKGIKRVKKAWMQKKRRRK
ncbi:MAG: adenylyltransferase/cytidyltransferase family protein [Candidatus Micrarchaeota archaeon]